MDWENLRIFAALAQGGSLSSAARRIGVEHATIARRVAALERETGLKLVDRRGRRLSLTLDGEKIAAIAQRMEGEALAVDRAAQGARTDLVGEIKISAPPALAATSLARAMVRLQQRHPGLRLRLVGEVRRAALDRREADIAIRLDRPAEGDLTIVKIGEMGFRFYASPAYLAATAPAAWRFIAYDESMSATAPQQELARLAAGRPIALRANALDIQQEMARAGGGIAILPEFVGAIDAQLVELPDAKMPVMRDLWLVVHTDLKDVPAVRAVLDELRKA